MNLANSQESCVPVGFPEVLFANDTSPARATDSAIERVLDGMDGLLTGIHPPKNSWGEPAANAERADAELIPPDTSSQREGACRTANEHTIVNTCIASASALLHVAHLLMNQRAGASIYAEVENEAQLSELAAEAGRGAYRAALMLVDPGAMRHQVKHGR
jgi:hypothetical protein